MQYHGCRSHMKDRSKVTELEDKFDMLVDSNDIILERVVSKLFLDVVLINCSVATIFFFTARILVAVLLQLCLVFPQSGSFPFYFNNIPCARPVVTAAKADGLWPKRKEGNMWLVRKLNTVWHKNLTTSEQVCKFTELLLWGNMSYPWCSACSSHICLSHVAQNLGEMAVEVSTCVTFFIQSD